MRAFIFKYIVVSVYVLVGFIPSPVVQTRQ